MAAGEEEEPQGLVNNIQKFENDNEHNDQGSNLSRRPSIFSTVSHLESRPSCFKSSFQEIMCIIVLTFAPACTAMTAGAYLISVNQTAEYFDITGGTTAWLIGSINLSNGACLLFMGSLADSIGRRNSIVIGFGLYAVFSLIGGFVNNFVGLCICRGLCGMLISLSVPSAFGTLGAVYKEGSKRKNRFNSVLSAGMPLGSVVGYLAGAICVQFVGSWRSIHYFYAIVYGLLTFCAIFSLPADKPFKFTELKETTKILDYGGAFLSLAGVTLLCFSMTQVDATEDRWHTPYILALLVVGIVLLIAFVVYECYVPTRPLIPMEIWKNKEFALCAAIIFFSWLGFQGAFTYYSAIYFEEIKHNSPILATAKYCPMFISGVLVNVFAALTLHIIPGRFLMILGTIGFSVAHILWATMSVNRSYWSGPFISFIFVVVGADFTFNISTMVTYSSVDKSLQSSASGLLNTVSQLGAIIGLAITSAIISAKNPDYGTTRQYDNIPELWTSFTYAFYFGFGCCVFALVLSLFLKVGVFHVPDSHDIETATPVIDADLDGQRLDVSDSVDPIVT